MLHVFVMNHQFFLDEGAVFARTRCFEIELTKRSFLGLRWGAPMWPMWPEISGWNCCRRFLPPKFPTQNVVGQELVHQFPIEKTAAATWI